LISLGLIAAPAFAQTNSIACTTTVCTAGIKTLVTSSASATFNVDTNDGGVTGTGFIAVVLYPGEGVPTVQLGATTITAEEHITFTAGHLGDSTNLNEPGMGNFDFGGFQDAETAIGLAQPTSFTVYEYNLGAYSSPGGMMDGTPGYAKDITVSGLSEGDVIGAWVENNTTMGSCKTAPCVNTQTPFTKSLTDVPEPASMGLLGTALLGAYGLLRRKLLA
jgi:hypothetical protein